MARSAEPVWVTPPDVRPDVPGVRRLDRQYGHFLVHGWAKRPEELASVEQMFVSVGGEIVRHPVTHGDRLDPVIRAFAEERLWLWEVPGPSVSEPAILPVQPGKPEPKPERPLELTWIEIRLVDEENGQPMPGEPYLLVLPGGERRTGRLDEHGLARVDGIQGGICDVTLTRIDGREWGLGPRPWPADELGAPREADREETPGPSDCVSSMAARAGFRDVRTVYEYEKNKDLRKRRPNPNLIGAGDPVVIPGIRERIATAPTATRTTFTVLESQTRLRIKFLGLRKQRYRLTVEGATFRGVVEHGGMIDHPIAPTATTGELVLEATEHDSAQRWVLAIGGLDPVSDARGARARLGNLAFPPGSVDALDEVAVKRAEDAYASWTSAAYDADALARRHDGSA